MINNALLQTVFYHKELSQITQGILWMFIDKTMHLIFNLKQLIYNRMINANKAFSVETGKL